MFKSLISQTMETLTETPVRVRNRERFIQATGKTENDYQAWASQVGRQMHINTLDRLVCAKLGVYTVAHLAQLPTELPEDMHDEARVDEYLIANSENPLELAKLWKQYSNEAGMFLSVETVLAEYLNPFPKGDFERWGDANHMDGVAKQWFRKGGVNLDVQVDEINEVAPIRVTIDDVIEFVTKWKPGRFKSGVQETLEQVEERFKEVTTFKIKDYYAEHLLRSSMLTRLPSDEVPF